MIMHGIHYLINTLRKYNIHFQDKILLEKILEKAEKCKKANQKEDSNNQNNKKKEQVTEKTCKFNVIDKKKKRRKYIIVYHFSYRI